jgi:hypothetical protein
LHEADDDDNDDDDDDKNNNAFVSTKTSKQEVAGPV